MQQPSSGSVQPVAGGWIYLDELPHDKDHYVAFVRPPH